MVVRFQALAYRCLRHCDLTLAPVQVLIGSNASGKSTFLDVFSFLATLIGQGVQAAFEERTSNPADLVWGRQPGVIEFALEAAIPGPVLAQLADSEAGASNGVRDVIRYEIRLNVDPESFEPHILDERVLLKMKDAARTAQRDLFPQYVEGPATLLVPTRRSQLGVINKREGGNDNYYSEIRHQTGKGWFPSYQLGTKRSALGNMPADENKFPASTWLRQLLLEGVQKIVLNSLLIRQASPPGQSKGFKADGANLPWVIQELKKNKSFFKRWIEHVRTALPDLLDVKVAVRPDDRHAYLSVVYRGGLEVPSWILSDGTLRLLALTIIPYLDLPGRIYLIEEPENGIHPAAVQTVFESLSSVREGQVLMASHSPVLLGIAQKEQLLCFAKAGNGAADIVTGNDHPALRAWKGDLHLQDLFASGILG